MIDDENEGIPLVIGVTGHRDLVPEECAIIKERVKNFFLQLQQDYPQLPLLIMTPLAEGADRLAAEVAHELDIPTVILLPMPRQIYQSDFRGDSLIEFHSLMEHSEVVELPLLPGVDRDQVANPGRDRDRQYARLGAYLAAHSHILLAIWDGKPSSAPGGTGHVIQFHLNDVIDLLAEGQHRSPIDFSEDESDLIYHVVCSRREDGPPIEPLQPGETFWLTRDDVTPRTSDMPQRYQVVFKRMSEFSRDMAQPVDEDDIYGLLDDEELARCSRGVREIAQIYNKVDYLARRYQRLSKISLLAAFWLMVSAGLCFIIYADLPDQPLMIYPYLLFVAAVFAIIFIDGRRGWQRKHVDYRVLAEGLRVQFFWSLAGVMMENLSRFSHDSFLKREDLELGWIRNVMRHAARRADAGPPDQSVDDLQLAIREWVTDQTDYYERQSRQRRKHHTRTKVLSNASYLLLLAVALVLAFYQWDIEAPWSNVLVALMGLLPLVATLRQNYAHRTAEHELIMQYSYTHRVFANAGRLLEATSDPDVQRDILRAVGEAELDENGRWLFRQRERPLTNSQLMHG
jgi:hypothetical protein